jgi:hypothetical protein
MALSEGDKKNFQTLKEAFDSNRVALVECKDAKTGEPVAVLCAMNDDNGLVGMVPFARFFTGNPYEELVDPFTAAEQDAEKATDAP